MENRRTVRKHRKEIENVLKRRKEEKLYRRR
jgi:hypothetical protein